MKSFVSRTSSFAGLALLALAAGCTAPTADESTASTSSAYSGRGEVDANVAKSIAIDATTVFVLGTDGNLWRETGDLRNRILVDSNVKDFQPLSTQLCYVLHNDNTLSRAEDFSIAGFRGIQVDSNVQAFQGLDFTTVYVLGTDGNLWREIGTWTNRSWVDSTVAHFQAIDATTVYVQGTDGKLWRETGNMHTREWVDDAVKSFQAWDSHFVYVLGSDNILWSEQGTMNTRIKVDSNVASYSAVNAQAVYVLGTDGKLWREVQTNQFRDFVDANVSQFQPIGGAMVYVKGTDNVLWREQMPAMPVVFDTNYISFDNGVPVGGSATVGVWPSGYYVFTGSFHDSGAIGYDDKFEWGLTDASGNVFTFQHQGSMQGTDAIFSPNRDDGWTNAGTNPALVAAFPTLGLGHWHARVNIDFADLWNELKTDFGYIKQVVAIVVAL